MVNQLAELVRIRFLSEIAKTARTPNGTYDFAKARAQVKKTYREIALLAHPDRNPGDKYQEELFKQMGAIFGEIEKVSDEQIKDYLLQANEPEFGGAGQELQALVPQAADAVENLAIQKADLEQRLARTQADIVSLRRGGQYHPEQLEIYVDQPRGIRITLANANQEIPRLINNGAIDPNTLLYSNAQRNIHITFGQAKPQIERLVQEMIVSDRSISRLQQDFRTLQQLSQGYQIERDAYKTRVQTLEKNIIESDNRHTLALDLQQREGNARYNRLAKKLEQETQAREALERLVQDTTSAATTLLTVKLSQQQELQETVVAEYKQLLENLQPQPTASQTQNPAAQNKTHQNRLFAYATYILSDKQSKTPESIDARTTLQELLQQNPTQFLIPTMQLATQLLKQENTNGAEYAATSLLSISPQSSYVWKLMEQSITQSPSAQRPNRQAWAQECHKNAESYQNNVTLTDAIAILSSQESLKEYNSIKAAKTILTQTLKQQPAWQEPITQQAQQLYTAKQYELAEEIALAITAALPHQKDLWQLAGDAISASKSASRLERQQWAQECYARAK